MKKINTIIIALALSGCNTMQTESETMKADRFDDTQEIGMFATQADARVIIANVNAGRFCAEPPPETQTTESKSFQLMMEAALNSTDDTAKIQAFRTFSQGLRQLYKRSHTNQIYRDASYYLCQAYLNGALTDKNIEVFLNMLIEAGESKDQKEIAAQGKKLLRQFETGKTNNKGSYLAAQLLLSQWAFASLKHETSKFYSAEAKINEGKAAAYAEGLDSISAKIQTLETNINEINSVTNNTLLKATDNSNKLDKIKTEMEKLPKQ